MMALPGTGDCVFLAGDRCLLPFAERPRMCRALEPDAGFECSSDWTRGDAAHAWFPWQGLVASVLERFPPAPLTP
jgi:hypothetical protein